MLLVLSPQRCENLVEEEENFVDIVCSWVGFLWWSWWQFFGGSVFLCFAMAFTSLWIFDGCSDFRSHLEQELAIYDPWAKSSMPPIIRSPLCQEFFFFFTFVNGWENHQKKNIFVTWQQLYEIHISVSLNFYLNTATLIYLCIICDCFCTTMTE